MSKKDANHYRSSGMECIDAMRAIAKSPDHFREFCRLTAFKYLWRCGKKGPSRDDSIKASDYLEWANETECQGSEVSSLGYTPEDWIAPSVPRETIYVYHDDLESIRKGEKRWVECCDSRVVQGDSVLIDTSTGSNLVRAQVTHISNDIPGKSIASIKLVVG